MTRDQLIAHLHDIAKDAQAIDDIEGLNIAVRAYKQVARCLCDAAHEQRQAVHDGILKEKAA